MKNDFPKQFLKLNGRSLLSHSTERMNSFPFFKSIIIVSHPKFIQETEEEVAQYLREGDRIVEGGATRHESTLSALNSISFDSSDIFVFHDAARPFFTNTEIYDVCRSATKTGASTLATNVSETVVESSNNTVISILNRNSVFLIKTPQALQMELYTEKLQNIDFTQDKEPTDLCSWTALAKVQTSIVNSNPFNIKITTKDDLNLAEKFFDLFLEWESKNPFDPKNCGGCSVRKHIQ